MYVAISTMLFILLLVDLNWFKQSFRHTFFLCANRAQQKINIYVYNFHKRQSTTYCSNVMIRAWSISCTIEIFKINYWKVLAENVSFSGNTLVNHLSLVDFVIRTISMVVGLKCSPYTQNTLLSNEIILPKQCVPIWKMGEISALILFAKITRGIPCDKK